MAKKPWEKLGIGKSTYFRKKAKGLLTTAQMKKIGLEGVAPKKRRRRKAKKSGYSREAREMAAMIDAGQQVKRKPGRPRKAVPTGVASKIDNPAPRLPYPVRPKSPYQPEDVVAATAAVQQFRGRRGGVNFSKLESAVAAAIHKARDATADRVEDEVNSIVRERMQQERVETVNRAIIANLADSIAVAAKVGNAERILTGAEVEALNWFFTVNADRV